MMNMNTFDKNGYSAEMGLYKSRYYAKKACGADEVVVKVDAGFGEVGYKLMSVMDARVWKMQK